MKKLYLISLMTGLSSVINGQSKLVFSYDLAGNQIERIFTNSASKSLLQKENLEQGEGITEIDLIEEAILNSLKIYTNPTEGLLKLEWDAAYSESIENITVSDSGALNTFQAKLIKGQNYVSIDLTRYASGLYIINFVLDNRKVISKKIIKN